jgi:hypothetical protein
VRQQAISGVICLSLAVLPAVASAQTTDTDKLPVSVERIQKALEKPPEIDLTLRRPDFSVSITETLVYDNPFGRVEKKRKPADWQAFFASPALAQAAGAIGLAAATASLSGKGTMSAAPLIAMDVLAAAIAIQGKIGTALHNRKIRKVREEVRRELEEFCAANGCTSP